ncbi:TPA: hypothetical protein N3Z77_004707 [Salmonella enterica subsp. enterica serovar 14:z:e,n,x]|nr:hypothetical protein [Salmonella enterica subsp. enterica serovar 14:z:e,n,x]
MEQAAEMTKPAGEAGLVNKTINIVNGTGSTTSTDYSLDALPEQWRSLPIFGLMRATRDRSVAKTPCALDGNTTRGVFNSDKPDEWLTLERAQEICAALNKHSKVSNVYFVVACIIQEGWLLLDQDDSANNSPEESAHSQQAQQALLKELGLAAYRSTSGRGAHSLIEAPSLWVRSHRYNDHAGHTIDIKCAGDMWALPGALIQPGKTKLTKAGFAKLESMFDTKPQIYGLEKVTNYARVKCNPDNGDEYDQTVINSLSDTTRAQLYASPTSTAAHLGEFAKLSDGSERFRRVAIELVRVSKNLNVAFRILVNSVMAQYDSRTRGQQRKSETGYIEWLHRQIADAGKYCVDTGVFAPFTSSLNVDTELNKGREPTTGEKAPELATEANPFAALVDDLPPATRKLYNGITDLMSEGYKHPEYALAMTFIIAGTMCHKKYVIKPNRESKALRLNTSVMIIGNSGTGKSTFAQLIDEMQQALGVGGHYEYLRQEYVKTYNPASSVKIVKMLQDKPSPLWRMGEFGASFQATLGNKVSTDPVLKTVLDVMSKRYLGGTTEPIERTNGDKTVESVHAPAFNVIADTTRAYLKHGGVKREDIANGLFARFVPFECKASGIARAPIVYDLDDDTTANIRTFNDDVLTMLNHVRAPFRPNAFAADPHIKVRFAEGIDRAALAAIGQEISDLITANGEDDLAGGFYNRLKDNVAIYAGMMAALENPDDPRVTLQMFRSAFDILRTALRTFLCDTREDFGAAPAEEFSGMQAAILLGLIKVKATFDNGGYALVKEKFKTETKEPTPMLTEDMLVNGWINVRYLNRISAINPQRKDKELIADAYGELLESGLITAHIVAPKKGGKQSTYYGLTATGQPAALKLLEAMTA